MSTSCLFPTKSCTHRESLNEEAIFPEQGKEKATPFLKMGRRTRTTCILTPTYQFPIGQTHSSKNRSFKRWGGWYVQSNFWLCTFLLHSCVETLLDITEVCSTYSFLCATHKCVNPTVHSLWKIKVVHRENFPYNVQGCSPDLPISTSASGVEGTALASSFRIMFVQPLKCSPDKMSKSIMSWKKWRASPATCMDQEQGGKMAYPMEPYWIQNECSHERNTF